MSLQIEIKECLNNIQKAFDANQFDPFIQYIRFPNFKNLEKNERINFSFPFTVLIGLNGSGKSSALHALYGAPYKKSTSDFWFNTIVDPIKDETGNPNCFIYGYKLNSLVEVLKQRTGSSKGSDYWESQAPAKKYDMIGAGSNKRTPPIKKTVVYIDFREQLSAFDKYFYFGKFQITSTFSSKQDVLRKYSQYLSNNIQNSGKKSFGNRTVYKKVKLNSEGLSAVNSILGKKYKECHLLFHDLYNVNGVTAYFITDSLNYSEAYAGRGEFAIVKLVYEILDSPKNSLVLLDEPEVSLHPGAQEALKLFLLKQTLTKKLQIIISTHSPKIVEILPDSAIKLFYENPNSKFSIKNKCNYIEAFQNIGLEVTEIEKNLIIVEDITAKLLLTSILKELGNEFELLFTVKYFPGGAEQMYKSAVSYAEENESHKFIFLDGDKKKPLPLPADYKLAQSEDLEFLNQKLKEATGMEFSKLGFRIDGNKNGGDKKQKIQSSLKYLNFLKTNLRYLPLNIPEELIWDETFANNLLKALGKTIPKYNLDMKNNINEFTKAQFEDVSSDLLLSSKKQLVNNFISKKNKEYEEIKDIILSFKAIIEI